jgi:hypothetical protein
MLRKDEIFAGQVGAPDGDFAYGSPQNESADGAEDGTPWCAQLAVDEWAFQEALLMKAGLAPDGQADTRNRSQLFEALHSMTRGLVAKGSLAQEAASGEDYYVRLPFVRPINPEWVLLQQVAANEPSKVCYSPRTTVAAQKLVIPVPQLLPRFAINGLTLTTRGLYPDAAQPMRVSLGRYSRELTNPSIIHTAVVLEGTIEYPFITAPGTDEPLSHFMHRGYIYVVEISPASEATPLGNYPSIYNIELMGRYHPLPASV